MRYLNTSSLPRIRRSRMIRVTRDAAIVVSAAAIVLVGAACSSKSKQATPTPTPAPQAAGAAKKAAEALKSEFKPLNAPVPLPLRKLDGLAISVNPFPTTLKPVKVDSHVGAVTANVGAIALPSFGVNMALGAPNPASILAGFGGGAPAAIPTMPAAIPTMPATIPTAPPGVSPGATPPAGFGPPAGITPGATPPAGFGLPPGITLPPGFTIPGMP